MSFFMYGFQAWAQYSRCGLTLYITTKLCLSNWIKSLLTNPRACIAFDAIVGHLIPGLYVVHNMHQLSLHFLQLNFSSQFLDHSSRLSKSCLSFFWSFTSRTVAHNFVSSANVCIPHPTFYDRSFPYTMNSKGPSINPCGTHCAHQSNRIDCHSLIRSFCGLSKNFVSSAKPADLY